MRGMGSENIDFRLRQCDFSADGKTSGAPWLGMKIADISTLDRVLVVGSTLRKDHPLIAHRLRQITKKTAQLNIIHSVDDDLLMRVANKSIVAPAALLDALAQVVKAAAQIKNAAVPESAGNVNVSEAAQRIAQSLASGKSTAVLLGNFAQHHPQAVALYSLAQALSAITGARFGFLGEAANSVGGHVAGATPSNGGKNASRMVAEPLAAYVLLGVEAELDTHAPQAALAAMKQAELVVAMSAYQHKAVDYAHVLLPVSPFTETAGTYVNTEGTVQSFNGVVQPLGETRPAWKVLRVLGNLLGLDGFNQDNAEDVRREALGINNENINLNNNLRDISAGNMRTVASGVQRIGEVPIYAADAITRRAPSLQKTRDALPPSAAMNRALAGKLGVRDGDMVRVTQGAGMAIVASMIDNALPADCIRLACAREETLQLDMSGTVTIERVEARQAVVV
jgi:NADH-quinone oxidoreductase subunit G